VSGSALVHVVVSGLATGCIYALVALSLVIVYNATRTVNFAQGEMLMVSAFVAWSAQHAGLPLPLALVAGVAAGGLLALLIERAIIRRAVAATHWDVLIITLGLSLVLRAAAGLVWTNEELPFPALFSNRPIAVGPVRLAPVSLGVIAASLILMAALVALFRATRFGRAMRAVAQNQTAARLMGIGVERVYSAAWVLAALLNADPAPTEARRVTTREVLPPRQLLTALRENRRQIVELLESPATLNEPVSEPPAFVPKRRGGIQSANAMA